ncbi:MAG TPA: hypothetical protein VL860_07140 [Planctomycetota bacterium]|nr:hypothetical protein [Planctomycetota bacterium]
MKRICRKKPVGTLALTALAIGVFCAGCAPTAQEWSELDALPPGPTREAKRAQLEGRRQSEERWWDFAGMAGTLAGGFLPGAGLAVAALRRARQAGLERDTHAAAALTLTGNLGQALTNLPAELRAQTLAGIKQAQELAGQRETIRGYLRRQQEVQP